MHSLHHSHVLQLDIQGTPQAWISLDQAAVADRSAPDVWLAARLPKGSRLS